MATTSHTPRKGRRRPNHNQNQHQHQNHAQIQPVTDYESDLPDMQPPSLTRTNEELNHAVLRRYYPHIQAILGTAPYAVLYQFSPDSSSWVKLEIEGTLFISQLQPSDIGASRFNVVILNRRGFDNFEQELKNSADIEVTSEYVIMQGGREGEEVVYGLWIFAEAGTSTEDARIESAKLIVECARKADETANEAMQGLAQLEQEDSLSGGVPMGRQLSLRELFGKQREQDAGFALHHHDTKPMPNGAPKPEQTLDVQPSTTLAATEQAPTPQLFSNPDTDFFRSGPRFTPKQDEQAPKPPPAMTVDANSNPLLMLLRGKG